ncbi:MAG: hypothetical protein ACI9ZF_003797 [Bradyrhizobium sp.]
MKIDVFFYAPFAGVFDKKLLSTPETQSQIARPEWMKLTVCFRQKRMPHFFHCKRQHVSLT